MVRRVALVVALLCGLWSVQLLGVRGVSASTGSCGIADNCALQVTDAISGARAPWVVSDSNAVAYNDGPVGCPANSTCAPLRPGYTSMGSGAEQSLVADVSGRMVLQGSHAGGSGSITLQDRSAGTSTSLALASSSDPVAFDSTGSSACAVAGDTLVLQIFPESNTLLHTLFDFAISLDHVAIVQDATCSATATATDTPTAAGSPLPTEPPFPTATALGGAGPGIPSDGSQYDCGTYYFPMYNCNGIGGQYDFNHGAAMQPIPAPHWSIAAGNGCANDGPPVANRRYGYKWIEGYVFAGQSSGCSQDVIARADGTLYWGYYNYPEDAGYWGQVYISGCPDSRLPGSGQHYSGACSMLAGHTYTVTEVVYAGAQGSGVFLFDQMQFAASSAATATVAAAATATAAPAATVAAQATATAQAAGTATYAPLATAVASATVAAAATATAAPAATVAAAATATAAASATQSVQDTATAQASATIGASWTATATATIATTPGASSTPDPLCWDCTPSAQASPSPTLAVSPSASASRTPWAYSSSSPTATGSPTPGPSSGPCGVTCECLHAGAALIAASIDDLRVSVDALAHPVSGQGNPVAGAIEAVFVPTDAPGDIAPATIQLEHTVPALGGLLPGLASIPASSCTPIAWDVPGFFGKPGFTYNLNVCNLPFRVFVRSMLLVSLIVYTVIGLVDLVRGAFTDAN